MSAQAAPPQGYSLTLTPLLQHHTQWLVLHGLEQSDPNTTMANGAAPSMKMQRHWWLVVDAAGRVRCSAQTRNAQAAAGHGMTERLGAELRDGCAALRAVMDFQPGPDWEKVVSSDAAAPTWAHNQICFGSRCAKAALAQRTLFNKASVPAAQEPAGPAPTRCVAGHWLIVRNSDYGVGMVLGGRFAGLPDAPRADIDGHEFVAIDGVAVLPPGLRCTR
jgi:hypothetical protein